MSGPSALPPLLLLISVCAAPAAALWLGARTESRRPPARVQVDGRRDEWTLRPEDDSPVVLYGAAHDDRFLYLVFVPHTRSAREQLSGVYLQDLVLWLDARGSRSRARGVQVAAPGRLGQTWRALEPLRLPASEDAAVSVAPANERGALEARIPLSWLGAPPPRSFTVGLEAQAPRRPPAPPPRRAPRDGPDFGPPRFEPFSLWVRVSLDDRR
jgi:hypothetical protein